MKKGLVFSLWLFLIMFIIASLYISFSAYLHERDRKTMTNVSVFIMGVSRGQKEVKLPYPEQTIFVYTKRPIGKFVSTNAVSGIDREEFDLFSLTVGKDTVHVYVKKVSLSGFLAYVSRSPLHIGLLVASFLLYVSMFYFTVKEFEITRGEGITEDLMNRLKALRLTLATFKVIPEESVEEMKRVVDGILKHKLSKR